MEAILWLIGWIIVIVIGALAIVKLTWLAFCAWMAWQIGKGVKNELKRKGRKGDNE